MDDYMYHQKALDDIRKEIIEKQRSRLRPRFFLDKNYKGNLAKHSFAFYAAGIITKDNTKEGIDLENGGMGAYYPPTNGKDFLVSFITPWGSVEKEHRSIDSVEIFDVTWDEYERIRTAQRSIYNECPYR